MYSSLDRIDAADDDGRCLQTDHRKPSEIAATPEVSVLFALTRVLKPRAVMRAKGLTPKIVYTVMDENLPAFFLEALAAAGAAEIKTWKSIPLATTQATPGELADRAFAALAGKVSKQINIADPEAALRELVSADPRPRDDDMDPEGRHWTLVAELAALAGEVIRKRHGGHWQLAIADDIPFAFVCPQGILHAAVRARAVANGRADTLALELEPLPEPETEPSHPIACSLRGRSEAVGKGMVFYELFPDAPVVDEELPVIVYGEDTPGEFRIASAKPDLLAEVHARALANVAKQDVQVKQINPDMPFYSVSGSFYATEKLLDIAFMKSMHERLGAESLIAGVPRRGLLLVAPGEPLEWNAKLIALVKMQHESHDKPISDAVVWLRSGEVLGRVTVTTKSAPEPGPKKRGLFGRLFKRDS